ncbi:zinc finger protein 462 isoform X4 [Agelaius tricolor]|uniref:zinc finger protein 462 isoform X4 n=1 Tax=Agelaius tricolor TaxID=9191 RepID=UPI0039F26322
MEVLQCDGCDFRAPSYEDLKAHIQDVHTAFLQPTDVSEESPTQPRSGSINASNQTEVEFSSVKDEFAIADDIAVQEPCKELPAEVVERSILESMVKPLTKSRGNFCCEWCSYQTPRRERWCDHMMKKHRSMVKILSSLRQQQDGTSAPEVQSKSAQSASPNSNYMSMNTTGREMSSANVSNFRGSMGNSLIRPNSSTSSKFSSVSYPQMKPKSPHNSGMVNLSDRSRYGIADMTNSSADLETSSMLNDSSSDEELNEMDSENGLNSMDHQTSGMSAEQLMGSDGNKLLETKGIPFRRYMNRFQCPFCPFLTMHRRSISRHIENIHLSGKTAVYKCDECPFTCKSSLKLGAHKQCHTGATSDWDTMNSQAESIASSLNDSTVSYESGNINGRKSAGMMEPVQPQPPQPQPQQQQQQQQQQSPQPHSQHPYKCTLCNYSTTTLKGLRVHQQHKHSFCDNLPKYDGPPSNAPQESEADAHPSASTVKKSQTSILGLSSKNNFVAKAPRKVSNDFPLDLSPVKKRTRIDEIASNLQSKISQNKQQEDAVINVEDDEEEEEDNEVEIEVELDREEEQTEPMIEVSSSYAPQQMWGREANDSQKEASFRSMQHDYNSTNGAEIELTLSEDEEDYYSAVSMKEHQSPNASVLGSQSNMYGTDQNNENSEFSDSGRLYYCKHCDFSNKSARSVSTHYQRMHPYIKFSFRYILDPNDHSAVYRCLECYIDYTNFEDLQQHYGEHHPEAMNVLNFDHSDLIYRCRFCSYTSPNVRSLMPHYQRMHPTVKINNAMIFSSYVVEQQEGLNTESQTLREILNSAPKTMATSTPVARGTGVPAGFNKSATKSFSPECENQKEPSVNTVVVYDCDVCSFASPNMHSVLVHYQKKHPEEKASYFRIQKTMRVVSVDRGSALAQMSFELGAPISPKLSSLGSQPPPPPPPPPDLSTELYYCKHCSYSNRSVVGVLVHYQKRHPEIKVTAKYIRQAPPTAAMMRAGELPPGIQRPPVSMQQLGREGSVNPPENEMFFCQHCDYGNRTVKGVLIHYQKKHRDFKANADVIRQHTATIRSLCDRGQKKSAGSLPAHASGAERDKSKLRALKCRQCSYTSPYFYALRKHIKKDHPNLKATVTSILRWAFLDGLIEAGYHCEWCIYSHTEPSGLLVHYQRRHPEHYVDYTYMATKLWAGPDPSPPALVMPTEMKTYKCRDCIFEASSIWDITNHYQAFHPWAMNGDESVLLDIIKEKDTAEKTMPQPDEGGVRMESEDQIAAPQMDQDAECAEDPSLSHEKTVQLASANPAISSTPYQCTVCQSEYNNLHGLLTHYGKKHPGMKVKAADFAQDIDINPGAVYKCRHCPYINTRIHGVLTHYQKRHPSVKVTAEDFVHDVEQSTDIAQNDVEETSRIFKQGYGAYRCKLCPYTHGTLEKLKIHYEKYHNQPEFDVFAQSPPKVSASVEPDMVTEIKASPEIAAEDVGEVSMPAPHFSSSHLVSHTVFRCQLCKYFCSTRKGIARHYRIKHNNVRAQPEGKNNLFKCALCSYTNPIRKGLAAHYQKRHDIDAYYTHCLAASRTVSDKPNKVIIPSPPKDDTPQLSEELRRAVEKKKCSLCSFQSFSKKGIVSHYMKRHPGVFPKKQHASKLGGYFTAVYADEHEKPAPAEERNDFEKPEVEAEAQEMEWLPFRCIKCFKLSFSTAELLCMHYTDHHSKDLKRDFSILGSGTRSQSPVYQCKHCDTKLHSTAELTAHLNGHNEEFQKRAKRQERRKQLLSKQKYADGAFADFKQERAFGHLEDVSKLKERKVVGYKCKFCVEVHPTLRAICNHLRKHVQYGNVSSVSATVKGLRSHERSHLALAMFAREDKYSCQYCSFVSAFRHNLDRHMQTHHGHHKPFRCKLCPFKSSYNSRLKTHILKAHADSSYSEPPDVQQQLNHYQSAALARNNNNISPIPLSGSAAGVEKAEAILNCEFCEFSSGYIQSIRRHYRDKHGGKKLFKCKDCSFYTGFKSAFTMHVEAGHSAVPEEGPKDLRCPLCLYHTKYKRNMIDHIVLHREERVVPIEVCRSKLSKYLQGVVFRCDKCTFTCSSDESLQQHIEKHNELKPYKCQLCYYETKHTEELDAHLRDEHKVSRNFELVGRVNLDQLEQMKGKTESSSSDEEEKEEELSPKAQERDPMMFPDSSAPEKRFPCEFCGRSFTEGSEWERHVLRHGMALNESKHRSGEDSQPKEDVEDTASTLPEEKESIEAMVLDYSHTGETAVSMVAADQPLLDTPEAKNE